MGSRVGDRRRKMGSKKIIYGDRRRRWVVRRR